MHEQGSGGGEAQRAQGTWPRSPHATGLSAPRLLRDTNGPQASKWPSVPLEAGGLHVPFPLPQDPLLQALTISLAQTVRLMALEGPWRYWGAAEGSRDPKGQLSEVWGRGHSLHFIVWLKGKISGAEQIGAAQVPSVGAVPVSGPPRSGRTLSPFPGAPPLEALPRGDGGRAAARFLCPAAPRPCLLSVTVPLSSPSLCLRLSPRCSCSFHRFLLHPMCAQHRGSRCDTEDPALVVPPGLVLLPALSLKT